MRVEVIAATPEHAAIIAPLMRAADVDEVYASSLSSPIEALEKSLARSPFAWTGCVDGEPVCMFGVGAEGFLSPAGSPWLLGTDGIMRHQLAFLRRCRGFVNRMLDIYPELENYVDARNIASIRWLKWLGFNIGKAEPFGALGLPFHKFDMRRSNV